MLDGWGPPEGGHRWAVGRESRMRLPVTGPGPDYVLVLRMAPWCDKQTLPAQTVMLAVNGRLMATVQFADMRVLAWRMPACCAGPRETVLSFSHVSSRLARPMTGLDRNGLPLGVMVLSVRLFRLPVVNDDPLTRDCLPGALNDGTLARAVATCTGLTPEELAMRFEGLGHDCEFGLIQRQLGAEPLSLLRFTGMSTPDLVDGLVARFDGVGAADAVDIFMDDRPDRQFRVHEQRYHLWYYTGRTPAETTRAAVLVEQCRRFAFLQRKFLADLRQGEKLYVVSRGECMTEPEALAIFCALNLEGSNTLVWTVHGDADQTGRVDALMPGFLRGHLGLINASNDATPDAWVNVLANSLMLHHGHGTRAAFSNLPRSAARV